MFSYRKLMIAIVGTLLYSAVGSECSAQGVAAQYQGQFRTVQNQINQYRNGGIYQQDSISPYYRQLRDRVPSWYRYRRIRPAQDARQNAYDNRASLTQQSRAFANTFGGSPSNFYRTPAATTGHTSLYMNHFP